MNPFVNARGRGTDSNPGNRFEAFHAEPDWDALEEISRIDPDFVPEQQKTSVIPEETRSLISSNSSPDIGFDKSLNPYRGCEHGCSYCYARPYHEYLGYDAGLDFETKIVAKKNAPDLLEQELSRPSWIPEVLAMSGVTDCYQPVERELHITRGCLDVLRRFRNPVGVITKNALVTRDIDHLEELASYQAASVTISITSLDSELAGKLEPRASRPHARLQALRELSEAGIPCGVSIAPVIPGLNDHEIPAILEAAAAYGADFAGFGMLRLPHGVKQLFCDWLERHFPGKVETVLGRVLELRDGKLNSSRFGERISGSGPIAEQVRHLFQVSSRRVGLQGNRRKLSGASFRRCLPGQLELF